MIREFKKEDLDCVMQIWLDTNIQCHNFISEIYWKRNYHSVKELLPQAEVYLYEDNSSHRPEGFIGLTGNYIAGIFVKKEAQSQGIGKKLLDFVKNFKTDLSLGVYQKNERAVHFYQREQFVIQSENLDKDTNEREFIMRWNNNGPVSPQYPHQYR